jgi:hypothetical protein
MVWRSIIEIVQVGLRSNVWRFWYGTHLTRTAQPGQERGTRPTGPTARGDVVVNASPFVTFLSRGSPLPNDETGCWGATVSLRLAAHECR